MISGVVLTKHGPSRYNETQKGEGGTNCHRSADCYIECMPWFHHQPFETGRRQHLWNDQHCRSEVSLVEEDQRWSGIIPEKKKKKKKTGVNQKES